MQPFAIIHVENKNNASNVFAVSLINVMKKMGPRIEPFGIPQVDLWCVQLFRKVYIMFFINVPPICIIYINLLESSRN